MQAGSIACFAAKVTWMWTSDAVSHLCRYCAAILLLLPPSLACCLISECLILSCLICLPLLLSHSVSHRNRKKPRGKVCYLFSGHLPGCTGPTTPGACVSLCPPLTCSLHCSPIRCEWHRADVLDTVLARSGVWAHVKNTDQSSLGWCPSHLGMHVLNSLFVPSVVS